MHHEYIIGWSALPVVLALCSLLGCDAATESATNLPGWNDDPSALVAGAAPCTAREDALTNVAHALASQADGHWERVPFDPAEAARSIRAGREASACFERAGLREPRRLAAASVLAREKALLRMVQQTRRAYLRARAKQNLLQALTQAERLCALLEPSNESTQPLRAPVERWARSERSKQTLGKAKS